MVGHRLPGDQAGVNRFPLIPPPPGLVGQHPRVTKIAATFMVVVSRPVPMAGIPVAGLNLRLTSTAPQMDTVGVPPTAGTANQTFFRQMAPPRVPSNSKAEPTEAGDRWGSPAAHFPEHSASLPRHRLPDELSWARVGQAYLLKVANPARVQLSQSGPPPAALDAFGQKLTK